jgi:hypothetical protein
MINVPEECIIYKHPVLDELFENRDKFLTKKCKHSFGGYAVQQIKKAKGLDKKMNWEKGRVVRKTPIDFCYVYLGNEQTIPLRNWLEIKGSRDNVAGGLSAGKRLFVVGFIGLLVASWFYFKLDVISIGIPFFGPLEIDWLIIPFFVLVMIVIY